MISSEDLLRKYVETTTMKHLAEDPLTEIVFSEKSILELICNTVNDNVEQISCLSDPDKYVCAKNLCAKIMQTRQCPKSGAISINIPEGKYNPDMVLTMSANVGPVGIQIPILIPPEHQGEILYTKDGLIRFLVSFLEKWHLSQVELSRSLCAEIPQIDWHDLKCYKEMPYAFFLGDAPGSSAIYIVPQYSDANGVSIDLKKWAEQSGLSQHGPTMKST